LLVAATVTTAHKQGEQHTMLSDNEVEK